MKVNDNNNVGPVRPTRPVTEGREKDALSTERTAHILPTGNRLDRVELSPAARELAKSALQELRQRTPHILPVDQKSVDAPLTKDEAQFSDAARKLVKGAVQALPADAKDRLEQVRQRVLSGAYDLDNVVSEVARRILERGDL